MGRLGAGELRPLPHEAFPVSRAADAFRHMATARHVGKIVLDLCDPGVAAVTDRVRRFCPCPAAFRSA